MEFFVSFFPALVIMEQRWNLPQPGSLNGDKMEQRPNISTSGVWHKQDIKFCCSKEIWGLSHSTAQPLLTDTVCD